MDAGYCRLLLRIRWRIQSDQPLIAAAAELKGQIAQFFHIRTVHQNIGHSQQLFDGRIFLAIFSRSS